MIGWLAVAARATVTVVRVTTEQPTWTGEDEVASEAAAQVDKSTASLERANCLWFSHFLGG